jgi:hypothetical protein
MFHNSLIFLTNPTFVLSFGIKKVGLIQIQVSEFLFLQLLHSLNISSSHNHKYFSFSQNLYIFEQFVYLF